MCVVTHVQFKENHKSMMNKSDEEKKKNINLLDCVKLFTVEEQLGEDDPWYIHACVCTYTYACKHVDTHADTPLIHITHLCTHTHTYTINTYYIVLGIVPTAKAINKLLRSLTCGNCPRS